MSKRDVVYLYVWSGDAQRARDLMGEHYPGAAIVEVSHPRFRASSLLERVGLLRGLRGRALVFHFQSLGETKYRQMLACLRFLHRCRETFVGDSSGRWEPVRSIPIFSILRDSKTLVFWWFYLRLRFIGAAPAVAHPDACDPEIAYLIPSRTSVGTSGGAISHIRGFLYGLKAAGRTCRVFAGTPLAQDAFRNEVIAAGSEPYFFWEAAALSYNFAFADGVQARLAGSAPRYLYQRHGSFSITGALLSRRLQLPLILEYNGSEVWIADHWDPTFFRGLVKSCEEVTLRCAARIVVVSEALRAEQLQRGIHADRIRVNPNGVDPDYFCPGAGRELGRRELAIEPDEVVIGFAGSFSLWHGIEILQQAIIRLLSEGPSGRLRFVLMGEGLLHGEMRSALAEYEATGAVVFTGILPSDKVVEYLDAADILVSPHIPAPDGSRFFGSPTKLFEYMAMGKAIVASRLEQLAEVLAHDETAWLVTPGDVDELVEAILRLAIDPAKRQSLGSAARRVAIERYSWGRNVAWALSGMPPQPGSSLAIDEGLHEHAGGSALLP
jgi:glycosyltransferase involved in cell wall biosynthesis